MPVLCIYVPMQAMYYVVLTRPLCRTSMAISSLWNFAASLVQLEVPGIGIVAESAMGVTVVGAGARGTVVAGGPPLAREGVRETSLGMTLTATVLVGATMIYMGLLPPGCPTPLDNMACPLPGEWGGSVPGAHPLNPGWVESPRPLDVVA